MTTPTQTPNLNALNPTQQADLDAATADAEEAEAAEHGDAVAAAMREAQAETPLPVTPSLVTAVYRTDVEARFHHSRAEVVGFNAASDGPSVSVTTTAPLAATRLLSGDDSQGRLGRALQVTVTAEADLTDRQRADLSFAQAEHLLDAIEAARDQANLEAEVEETFTHTPSSDMSGIPNFSDDDC